MSSVAPLPPLARLYRESFDDVWSVLRRLGVPEASLEDAVHDVFVVVHRRRKDFEGRCAVRTWLYGIARRVAFRHRRTEARTQRRHQALAAVPPVADDAHEQLARREAWVALQRFLAELDRPQRDAFVLGELQRLSRTELGAALGVSPNTAYSRLRAARARFTETFASGRPSSHTVLAAGRDREDPPRQAQRRVWLALGSGLELAPGATASTVTTVWSAKAVLTSVGLASTVLGMVAVVAPGARSQRVSPSVLEVDPGASTAATLAPARPPARESSVEPVIVAERPATERPAEPPPLAPRRSPPRAPTTSVGPRPTTTTPITTPVTTTPATTLSAEAALLRTAHAALARSSPTQALEALREHQRRFEHGVLAEEREASIIRAQCALGRAAQAHREARRFLDAHPRSAYLEALSETCVATVIKPSSAGDPPQ